VRVWNLPRCTHNAYNGSRRIATVGLISKQKIATATGIGCMQSFHEKKERSSSL